MKSAIVSSEIIIFAFDKKSIVNSVVQSKKIEGYGCSYS